MLRRVRIALVASMCCIVAEPVFAAPGEVISAEALYQKGRELLAEGRQQEACAKFEASMMLNERPTTLLNLASCSEKAGKLTEALARYKRVLETLTTEKMAPERLRALEKLAVDGKAAVEPRIGRLRVRVEPVPDGLELARDGVALHVASLDEPLPTDPGAHEIVAQAPGYERVVQSVTVPEAGLAEITLRLKKGATPAAAPPASEQADPSEVPAWAWAIGAVGVVSVGVGIGFLVDARSAESTIEEQCGPERVCAANAGYDPADDNARKDRSFGIFVAVTSLGGAALVAAVIGAAVGLSADGSPAAKAWTVQPWLAPKAAGLGFQEAF